MDNFITASEAARRLGVSKSTMAQWCQDGRVPNAQKVTTVWLIPVDSLDKIDRPKMGRPPKKDE